MKNLLRKLVPSLLIVLALSALSGCGKEPYVAVVYGCHSNARVMNLEQAEPLTNALKDVAKNQGYIAMVKCDGYPSVYSHGRMKKLDLTGDKKIQINERTSQLLKELLSAKATDAEVDTLEAISKAANALSDAPEGSPKSLYIADTGLSTFGYLKFSIEGAEEEKGRIDLRTNPDDWGSVCNDVVENLKKAHALPDLNGVSVTWLYLGQGGEPQNRLPPDNQVNLENLWRAVLEAAGAEVSFQSDDATDDFYKDLPAVSVIPVGDWGEIDFFNGGADLKFDDNSELRFKGKSAEKLRDGDTSAEFIDHEKAVEALKKVADELNAKPERNIYIVGTTAGVTGELSTVTDELEEAAVKRAEAAKTILVEEYGIDANRLTCKGYVAEKSPWYIEDKENGKQIKETARQNRAVHFIDTKSELAKDISE